MKKALNVTVVMAIFGVLVTGEAVAKSKKTVHPKRVPPKHIATKMTGVSRKSLEDQAWADTGRDYSPSSSPQRARRSEPFRGTVHLADLTQQVPRLIGRRSWWGTLVVNNYGGPFVLHFPFVELRFDDYSESTMSAYEGFDDSGTIPNLTPGEITLHHGTNTLGVYGDDMGTNDTKKPIRARFLDENVGSIQIFVPR